jgi:hypothetical protein
MVGAGILRDTNHFHLALRPYADREISVIWMQWLLTAHVRRYHQHYALGLEDPAQITASVSRKLQ